MNTWYQIYREGYWYTSTTDKQEAYQILSELQGQGYAAEVRIR